MRNLKRISTDVEEEERVRAQTSRVDRIKTAMRLELRACTDRASEVVEQVRQKVNNAPPLRLVKVHR